MAFTRKVLSTLGLLMALSTAALASTDPTIFIDSGDPLPLLLSTDLGQVQPNGTDPLTFDFLNDTGAVVTSLLFQTTINAGLSTGASGSFTPCQSGLFANCTVFYNPSNGALSYDAFGLNPLAGENGIAVNSAFHITLVGWTSNASANGEQLYSGLPTFNNSFTAAPEPSSFLLFGSVLLIAGLIRRSRRSAPR
jgi:hypothetical protein